MENPELPILKTHNRDLTVYKFTSTNESQNHRQELPFRPENQDAGTVSDVSMIPKLSDRKEQNGNPEILESSLLNYLHGHRSKYVVFSVYKQQRKSTFFHVNFPCTFGSTCLSA